MKLSIGIVNYNSGRLLSQCLHSIHNMNGVLNECKILVFDNGSIDNSGRDIRQTYPGCLFEKSDNNIGFAAAANRLISATNSKYILLINPDTVVFPDAIRLMIDFMDKNPKCGVLGGDIISPVGYPQSTCRLFPNYINILFGRRSIMRKLFPDNPISRSYLYLNMNRSCSQQVDFVEGSLMMLRREAVEQVGKFDERFFLYLEDADLCYRMAKKGWHTWWLPRSYAIHYRGENYRKDNIRPAIYHSRGFYHFFVKHYDLSKLNKLTLKFLLALRLVYVISLESIKRVFHDINYSPHK